MRFAGLSSLPCCGIAVLLAALIRPCPVTALERDWSAALVPPADGKIHHPAEAVRVRLPSDIDNETLQWLALELDGIDVTGIVTLDGTDAVVQPPQPLAPGVHAARLVQYTPAGGIVDRGAWEFEVRSAMTWQFVSEVTFNGSQRTADADIPEEQFPEHRTTGDGGARFQGTVFQDDWKMSGSLDLIYNSEPGPSLDELEGGEYLIEGVKGPLTLDVGHHSVGSGSLVMEGFHRRGASLSYAADSRRLSASGFAFRSQPVSGFRHGFGVEDEKNRVTGISLTTRPLPGTGDALSLSGVYLYGEQGTQPGVAVIDDEQAGEGSAWSLALESLLGGGKIAFRGEYAETRFDPDGSGIESGKESDDALSLRGTFVPWQDQAVKGRSFSWEVGAAYQKVGTRYHSLANPGLPSDLETLQGFTTLAWGGLNLEASAGREEDNVEGLDLLPTTRSDFAALGGSYTFLSSAGEKSAGVLWLGRPVLSVNARQSWDTTEEVPADYEGGEIDLRTREFQVSLASAYPSWNWFAGHTRGWQDDFTGETSDLRSDVTEIYLNLQLLGRVTLGGRGQLNTIREEETGLEFEERLAGVEGSFVLVKDRLTARLSYQVDTQETNDGLFDQMTETTDFDVNWTVVKAVQNRPALSLWLRGQYREEDDRTGTVTDTFPYQVFCGFTIGLPYTFPRGF